MNVWVIDMKKYILGICAFICTSALAQEVVVMSPDTHLKVNIEMSIRTHLFIR